MKKLLSLLTILTIGFSIGCQDANAFSWSSLNPAYWGHCPRCERKKADCGCKKKKCNPCKKKEKECPCTTGAAAPCDPCKKEAVTPCDPCQKQTKPCDACDRLQEMQR